MKSKIKNQSLSEGLELASEILKTTSKVLEESRHSHDKCMECDKPPTHEVLWAEGHGHAWFCDEHLKSWSKENGDDIVYLKEVKDGVAAMKFSDNKNPNIKESTKVVDFTFTLHHRWWPSKLVEGKMDMPQKFELRIDKIDSVLEIITNADIIGQSEFITYIKESQNRDSFKIGESVQRVISPLDTDISKKDISWMHLVDKGSAKMIESTDILVSIELKGDKLSGVIDLHRTEKDHNYWVLKKLK